MFLTFSCCPIAHLLLVSHRDVVSHSMSLRGVMFTLSVTGLLVLRGCSSTADLISSLSMNPGARAKKRLSGCRRREAFTLRADAFRARRPKLLRRGAAIRDVGS